MLENNALPDILKYMCKALIYYILCRFGNYITVKFYKILHMSFVPKAANIQIETISMTSNSRKKKT